MCTPLTRLSLAFSHVWTPPAGSATSSSSWKLLSSPPGFVPPPTTTNLLPLSSPPPPPPPPLSGRLSSQGPVFWSTVLMAGTEQHRHVLSHLSSSTLTITLSTASWYTSYCLPTASGELLNWSSKLKRGCSNAWRSFCTTSKVHNLHHFVKLAHSLCKKIYS